MHAHEWMNIDEQCDGCCQRRHLHLIYCRFLALERQKNCLVGSLGWSVGPGERLLRLGKARSNFRRKFSAASPGKSVYSHIVIIPKLLSELNYLTLDFHGAAEKKKAFTSSSSLKVFPSFSGLEKGKNYLVQWNSKIGEGLHRDFSINLLTRANCVQWKLEIMKYLRQQALCPCYKIIHDIETFQLTVPLQCFHLSLHFIEIIH